MAIAAISKVFELAVEDPGTGLGVGVGVGVGVGAGVGVGSGLGGGEGGNVQLISCFRSTSPTSAPSRSTKLLQMFVGHVGF